MATAKAKPTELPVIQIDDEVREMTNQEFISYSEIISGVTGSNDK